MPKVNVYLPESLAAEVRNANLPVSAICQRALERVIREMGGWEAGPTRPSFFGAYGRFLQRARETMELASMAASQRGLNFLGPEHVLVGMLEQGSNFGVGILEALGVSPDEVFLRLEDMMKRGPDIMHNAAFDGIVTEGTKKVLALAAREAAHLGHTYIGNEHLLYGLVAEEEAISARVLAAFGVTTEGVRRVQKDQVRTWVVADMADLRVNEQPDV